jgi:hypothetical protein
VGASRSDGLEDYRSEIGEGSLCGLPPPGLPRKTGEVKLSQVFEVHGPTSSQVLWYVAPSPMSV